MKRTGGLAGFKHDVRELPFWVKLVGSLLCLILPPLGWILAFVVIVLLNWPIAGD